METLTYEVVRFHGTYHAILGYPCYAKFMVVPNYTYWKLKMPGQGRVITSNEVTEETPDHQRSVGSFKPVEGAKEVLIDPSGSKSKVVRIGTALSFE